MPKKRQYIQNQVNNMTKITIKSNYLTSRMVKDGYKDGFVQAENIREEKFDKGDKWVIPLLFKVDGKEEVVEYVPNKTMLKEILNTWGSESNQWDGMKLTFSIIKVPYQGNIVDSIMATPEPLAAKK